MVTLLSLEPWFAVTAGYSAQYDNYSLTVYGPRRKERDPGGRIRWMLEFQVGYSGIDREFVFAPALLWHAHKPPRYLGTRRLL